MRRRVWSERVVASVLGAALLVASCAQQQGPAVTGGGSAAGGAQPAAAAPTGKDAFPLPTDPETKIKASWCAVAGAMFPLWVAKDAGIFQRHKLDVDIQLINSAEANVAALARGEVDFIECTGGALIPGFMAGVEGVMIGNLYQGNPYRLVVVPEIQTMSDLKGRKLAISRAGDYDNRLVEVMLERFGLVANQDVTLVPIGGQTDRFNALKSGIVDGTTVNPPVNIAAQNAGFRELYNLGDLNFASVYISLFTMKNTIQQRPRMVERFLAAMIEAEAYSKANPEFTINTMSQYLNLQDRAALEGAYQAFAVETMAIPPQIPVDAVQGIIDETLRFNPNASVREASKIVDSGPLQAVAGTGFIDAVVAEYPPAR